MGFLLRFFLSRGLGRKEFLSGGSKDPQLQRNTSDFAKPRPNALRRQTGCVNTQESALRNGFVSRYELPAAFHDRLAAMIYFSAYRPAGTREALPGTMLRDLRPAFSLEGTPESGPLRNSSRPTAKFELG